MNISPSPALSEITAVVITKGSWKGSPTDFLIPFTGFFNAFSGRNLDVYLVATTITPDTAYPPQLSMITAPFIPENIRVYNVPNSLYSFLAMAAPVLGLTSTQVTKGLENLAPTNLFATDCFLPVFAFPGMPLLVNPLYFPDSDTNLYKISAGFAFTAQADGYLSKPVQLQADGGNMLFGGKFLLAGMDILEMNFTTYKKTIGDISRQAYQSLITESMKQDFLVDEVVWLGSGPMMPITHIYYGQGQFQPLYHTDIFATLLGIYQAESPVQLIAIAQPVAAGKTDEINQKLFDSICNGLDEIATGLVALPSLGGFPVQVIRVPLVMMIQATDEALTLTYNNCLVEICETGEKNVYIPRYKYEGQDKYEQQVVQVYKSVGFNCIWVEGNYTDLANFQYGALHCEVNVVRRAWSSGSVPPETGAGMLGLI